jgi:hypothetical protein
MNYGEADSSRSSRPMTVPLKKKKKGDLAVQAISFKQSCFQHEANNIQATISKQQHPSNNIQATTSKQQHPSNNIQATTSNLALILERQMDRRHAQLGDVVKVERERERARQREREQESDSRLWRDELGEVYAN